MTDNTNETLGETAEEPSWLEQFKALANVSLEELETVVKAGLQPAENEALILIAAKLVELAMVHDPDAADKVLTLLHNH